MGMALLVSIKNYSLSLTKQYSTHWIAQVGDIYIWQGIIFARLPFFLLIWTPRD